MAPHQTVTGSRRLHTRFDGPPEPTFLGPEKGRGDRGARGALDHAHVGGLQDTAAIGEGTGSTRSNDVAEKFGASPRNTTQAPGLDDDLRALDQELAGNRQA